MNKKKYNRAENHFLKGFAIGAAFCGSVALLLLIVMWILL